MLSLLMGVFLSLLPRRWARQFVTDESISWQRAGALSGILEAVGSVAGLGFHYWSTMQYYTQAQLGPTMQATQGAPGYAAGMAVGFTAYVMFLVSPLTWILVYFLIEGAVRAMAAIILGQVTGTLPLVAVDGILRIFRQRAAEAKLPRVADTVVRGEPGQPWDLRVESCRPKPDWKYPLTVRHAEEFFQVMGEAPAGTDAARPYVYLLQRVPPGEGFRGMDNYDPESVLRGPEEAGMWAQTLAATQDKIRAWRLPLVADQVLSEGETLRIESCRQKPDWSSGRLIHYEGTFYRLESAHTGSEQRPYGFCLRALPAGVLSRSVIRYSPEDVLRRPRH